MMFKFSNLITVFLFSSTVLLSQDFESVEIRTEFVRDNIHVLYGSGGNIGVLSGPDGAILIDDQFEPLGTKITHALKALGMDVVQMVINTHFHFDHSDGNKAFGKEGAIIVAHTNARDKLMKDITIEVPGFDTVLQQRYPNEALPDITTKSDMTLFMNGQSVRLIHLKNAHTDTDLIVHFLESNVIHAGDIFVRYGIPFIDAPNGGSFKGMINAANALLDLTDSETIIIPGHGQLSNRTDLLEYSQMLKNIWDTVASGHESGKSLEEIIDEHPAAGYAGEANATYIVMMIYEELAQN